MKVEVTHTFDVADEQLLDGISKAIEKHPDFVMVVRCVDCKHYGDVGDCEVHPYDGRFSNSYFCADGERKEE